MLISLNSVYNLKTTKCVVVGVGVMCGHVLLFVDMVLFIADSMSLVYMSRSVRCLFVSRTIFSMHLHQWLSTHSVTLGRLFEVSLATSFSVSTL